jgi:hypothetical protein
VKLAQQCCCRRGSAEDNYQEFEHKCVPTLRLEPIHSEEQYTTDGANYKKEYDLEKTFCPSVRIQNASAWREVIT